MCFFQKEKKTVIKIVVVYVNLLASGFFRRFHMLLTFRIVKIIFFSFDFLYMSSVKLWIFFQSHDLFFFSLYIFKLEEISTVV